LLLGCGGVSSPQGDVDIHNALTACPSDTTLAQWKPSACALPDAVAIYLERSRRGTADCTACELEQLVGLRVELPLTTQRTLSMDGRVKNVGGHTYVRSSVGKRDDDGSGYSWSEFHEYPRAGTVVITGYDTKRICGRVTEFMPDASGEFVATIDSDACP
jgi:hypothetical protein